MKLVVNGKEEIFDDNEISVSKLLVLKDVKLPQMVSVQLNGEFIQADEHESRMLKDGDNVEFLYFMGGGR